MNVTLNQTSPIVWRLTLRPNDSGRTVVSDAGLQVLLDTLAQAQRSETCRVLTLEGHNGVFCEGMDLSLASSDDHETLRDGVHRFAELLGSLRSARQVVVALVDGVVRAGGVGIVAASDVILATERSTFGLPEINLGLLPAMVYPFLCERMPVQKARRWVMAGQSWDATRALQAGFVDEVVDDAERLEKKFRREVRQWLRAHPRAVADLKQHSLQQEAQDTETALRQGAHYTATLLEQDSIRAGLQLFLAGDPLPWFDRYRPKDKS